jgi:hypothetical protein
MLVFVLALAWMPLASSAKSVDELGQFSTSVDCHTAVEGEGCYEKVKLAMTTGIQRNPELYGNLTDKSTFREFQQYLHDRVPAFDCAVPCMPVVPLISYFTDERYADGIPSEELPSQDVPNCSQEVLQAPLNATGLKLALSEGKGALEAFTTRLLETEGRVVRRKQGLLGFVEKAVREASQADHPVDDDDFDKFASTVRSSAWVDGGIGREASLNVAGFERLASAKTKTHMTNFLLRIADRQGKVVADEEKFDSIVNHFTDGDWTFPEVAALMTVGSFLSENNESEF